MIGDNGLILNNKIKNDLLTDRIQKNDYDKEKLKRYGYGYCNKFFGTN